MIWAALILGMMGSLHCIGMCGPIAIPLSQIHKEHRVANLIYSLKYNTGRIISYASLGLIFGLASQIMEFKVPQNMLSIVGGSFLVLLFLFSMNLEGLLFKWGPFANFYKRVQQLLGRLITGTAARYPTVIGMANGILPCGLVYVALTAALTTGTALKGALFMACFGLGTVPAMLGLMVSSSFVGRKLKGKFHRVYPLIHLVFGVLLIVRGIGMQCAH